MKTITTNMLLGGVKSNNSIDQPMYINVDLSNKSRAFKKTKIDETMDLYSLYKSEKDSCTRYRLLFIINPVCTNILFNRKTEIVAFEGSDKCVALSDYVPLNKIISDKDELFTTISGRCKNSLFVSNLYLCNAIKDTEFSHPELGNLSYHCGADISNNHLLRSKDFAFNNYITARSGNESRNAFNTISDIARSENGVEEVNFTGLTPNATTTKAHLYGVDTIMTFNESFLSNMYEKDGWFGFNNASNINIDNLEYDDGSKKTISVNRVINNVGPCSFIDLYPDRSLFSAVPKYNEYRHRQEHNWDYCLTYPFENEKEKLYVINGHVGKSSDTGYLGMKMTVEKIMRSNMGEKIVLFKTNINHNLHLGRYINLYMQIPNKNGDYDTVIHDERIQVVGVGLETGLEKEKYFSVRESDMPSGIYLIELPDETFYDANEKGTGGKVLFSYRNNVNNTPCDYYIRKFKKIEGLTYNVTKMAFGTNIYGDDMAQLMFNEDVDLSGLLDNRGRELSEIYLTIIKTNRGHDLWYARPPKGECTNPIVKVKKETENKRDERVEFSHCFGKVTSGVEMNDDSEDYNVYKLHNIDTTKMVEHASDIKGVHKNITDTLSTKDSDLYATGTRQIFGNITPPKSIEDDITVSMANGEFLGDIVEFNPNDYTETILARIFYRFNTEQRECYYNEEYFNIFYDDLIQDDFDSISIEDYSTDGKDRKFNVEVKLQNITETINGGCSNSAGSGTKADAFLMAGNLNPEGYYYSPHNRIVVKELSEEVSEASMDRFNINPDNVTDNFVSLDKRGASGVISMVKVLSPRLYNFKKGENIMFYNKETQQTVFGVIDTVLGKQSVFVKVKQDGAISEIIDTKAGKEVIDSSLIPDKTIGFEPETDGVYKIKSSVLVLYTNITVPSYAIFRPSTSSYIWRAPINVTDVTSASTLYDIPFSNGAIYIERNINLFLKRQDPHELNYLYNYDERPNAGPSSNDVSSSISSFLRKEGMPKLDLRYLLEGDIDISLDLC